MTTLDKAKEVLKMLEKYNEWISTKGYIPNDPRFITKPSTFWDNQTVMPKDSTYPKHPHTVILPV